jgi:predicted lipoprotein with Yx(FWY)xxD motif
MLIYLKKNLVAVMCIALTFTLACKKSDEVTPPILSVKKGIQLATDTKFGLILTDSVGRTLYYFASDVTGSPSCNGSCETTWPVYYSANTSTDANLNAAGVGVVTRADGKKQSTYKGYPLYYFKDDVTKGDVKGEGVGNVWFVAKPDYTIMLANTQLIGANAKLYTNAFVEGVGKTVYLTDDRGRALYAFSPDKNGKNTYTADANKNINWPVYETEIKAIPSIIAKDLFAVIDVATIGKRQLTYKGWPLDYFSQDAIRGETKGISVGTFPGFWPVLTLATPGAPN